MMSINDFFLSNMQLVDIVKSRLLVGVARHPHKQAGGGPKKSDAKPLQSAMTSDPNSA